jgi:hypothetical protein
MMEGDPEYARKENNCENKTVNVAMEERMSCWYTQYGNSYVAKLREPFNPEVYYPPTQYSAIAKCVCRPHISPAA